MSEYTEVKSELWAQIVELGKSDSIVHMAFELLNQGMLEDKENLLMLIVVKQQGYIKNLEEQNNRLRTDYYAKKSAEKNEKLILPTFLDGQRYPSKY